MPKVPLHSPVPIIHALYLVSTPDQRKACLRYLLHYQHYNAEFTIAENQHLGYPQPLCAVQAESGYIRNDYRRLFDLVKPSLKPYFTDDMLKNINLASILAIPALQMYDKNYSILSFPEWEKNRAKNPILIIDLKFSKSKAESFLEEIKIYNERLIQMQLSNQSIKVIFLLRHSSIDCQLMLGATWHNKGSASDFKIEKLSDNHFFGEDIFSFLNSCGVTPDRLVVNEFITTELGKDFAEDLTKTGIAIAEPAVVETTAAEKWCEHIEKIRQLEHLDSGSKILCYGIIKWHEKFLSQNPSIFKNSYITSLLNEQVLPWVIEDSTIVEWAKGYQNLCEIILFCLDYYPELIRNDFDTVALNALPMQADIHKDVYVYPYAMSGIFNILDSLVAKHKTKNNQKLTIGCITQNYFEILEVIKKIEDNAITVKRADYLNEIKAPDILIADIHPNNAAREQLFKNDIIPWLKNNLSKKTIKFTLILDITLNNIQDPELQNLLAHLQPFIVAGRVEVFLIQSLAKLMQLGADNLSGGMYYHLSNSPSEKVTVSRAVKLKETFFRYMMQDFSDLIERYFLIIRKNTNFVYKELLNFSKDTHDMGSYCAIKLTSNVDEETAYVAICFTPFFDKLKINKKEQDEYFKKFHELLLAMAQLRDLPLTARQSIGFSLSVMNCVVNVIRMTIGGESKQFMRQYVDLLKQFNYVLTEYASSLQKTNVFDIDQFVAETLQVYKILKERSCKNILATIPIKRERHLFSDEETVEILGEADIYFTDNKLSVQLKYFNDAVKILQETEIGLQGVLMRDIVFDKKWTDLYLLKLFFHTIYLKSKNIFIEDNKIDGILSVPYMFRDRHQIKMTENGYKLIYTPKFTVMEIVHPNEKIYRTKDISILWPEKLGASLANISMLTLDLLREFYQRTVHYQVIYQVNEAQEKLSISFGEKKHSKDYVKLFVGIFKNDGISGLIKYLNQLDIDHLVMSNQEKWNSSTTTWEYILLALSELGENICLNLDDSFVINLSTLKEKIFIEQIIRAIFIDFFQLSIRMEDANEANKIAQHLAGIFSREEFNNFICYDEFNHWIYEVNLTMYKNPNNSAYAIYFDAISPMIKKFYADPGDLLDTNNSILMHTLVSSTSLELIEYFIQLENDIPIFATQNLPNRKTIRSYFDLYMFYPLSNDVKRKLLAVIRAQSHDKLNSWFQRFNFYYEPMDEVEIDNLPDPECEVIISEIKVTLLQDFFLGSGFGNIALDQLTQRLDVDFLRKLIRLQFIMRDLGLRRAILDNIQKYGLSHDDRDELKDYVGWIKNFTQANDIVFINEEDLDLQAVTKMIRNSAGLSTQKIISAQEDMMSPKAKIKESAHDVKCQV